MLRSALTSSIKSIYRDSLMDNASLRRASANRRLFAKINSIKEQLSEEINSSGLDSEFVDSASDKADNFMNQLGESITSCEEGITEKDVLSNCDARAEYYVDLIRKYTLSGGTGFYDIGIVFNIMYESQAQPFESKISEWSETHDFKIIHSKRRKNPENSSYGIAANYSAVMPSSDLEAFMSYISGILDQDSAYKTSCTLTMYVHFILPKIFEVDMLTPEMVTANTKYYLEDDDSWAYEAGISTMGYGSTPMRCHRSKGISVLNQPVQATFSKLLLAIGLNPVNQLCGIRSFTQSPYIYEPHEIEALSLTGTKQAINRFVNPSDDLKLFGLLSVG